MARTPFIYSGFFDRPLAFVVWHSGAQYLFWRGFFDDDLDDYPRNYEVYRLPGLTNDVIRGGGVSLPERAIDKVASVPFDVIVFDPTNRRWIDSAIFATLGIDATDGSHLAP